MSKFLKEFAQAFVAKSLVRVEHDTIEEGPRVRVGRIIKFVPEKGYATLALDVTDQRGGGFRSLRLELVTAFSEVQEADEE